MIIYLQMIKSEADKEKFEQLYTEYKNLMFSAAQKILRNQQDAEDAVHQAFTSIAQNIENVGEVKCPKTKSYVVIISENKAIDIYRDRKHYAPYDDDDMAISGINIPLPGDSGLADALARLPARYREVLMLRFDNGFSTRELAKMLNMTQSNVQKLLWRAKDALRKELEKGGKLYEV